jgi:Uncharacterized membrane-associated protein/domain
MFPIIMVSIMIYLMSNGSLVSMNVTTTQSVALLNVTLPVEPIGPTLTVQSANGTSIPAILISNHLIIPAFSNGTFIIKYVPLITQTPSGYLAMNVSSPYVVNLFIGNSILLTHLPINLIVNFTRISNGIILQLAPGNYTIGFVPETPTTGVATTNTTTTIATTNTTKTSTQSTSNQTSPKVTKTTSSIPQYVYYVVPTVIIVAIALLIYVFIIRHRGPEVNPIIVEGLNPTDKEVIKALMEMGGEAYQADLQRKLNMPKATLWRAIKRLESAGYVQVVKEGRMNKIKLIKN